MGGGGGAREVGPGRGSPAWETRILFKLSHQAHHPSRRLTGTLRFAAVAGFGPRCPGRCRHSRRRAGARFPPAQARLCRRRRAAPRCAAGWRLQVPVCGAAAGFESPGNTAGPRVSSESESGRLGWEAPAAACPTL